MKNARNTFLLSLAGVIALIGIAVVLVVSGPGRPWASPVKGPTTVNNLPVAEQPQRPASMSWNPDSLVVTLSPGETKAAGATARFWNTSTPPPVLQVPPALAPFMTVTPGLIGIVPGGKWIEYDFDILVTVASGTPSQTLSGTLAGSGVRPLPLTVIILAPPTPEGITGTFTPDRTLWGYSHNGHVYLWWEPEESAYEYIIYRSGSPNSPWIELDRLPMRESRAVDYSPDLRLGTNCYHIEAIDSLGHVIRVYQQSLCFDLNEGQGLNSVPPAPLGQPEKLGKVEQFGSQISDPNTMCLSDADFEDNSSMTLDEIRDFLNNHPSCLKGTIADVDGQMIEPALLIYQAAQSQSVNPHIILAMLEKEQSAITFPSLDDHAKRRIMGYMLPADLKSASIRQQIADGTAQLRNDFDRLGHSPPECLPTDNPCPDATQCCTNGGWQLGIGHGTDDGSAVTPATKTVAVFFSYNPVVGYLWGGNHKSWGGNYRFCEVWRLYGFASPPPSVVASISGKVYNDYNGDGAYQAGEPPLSDWPIMLLQGNTSIATIHTDINGKYSFPNLSAGDYRVVEARESGWTPTAPLIYYTLPVEQDVTVASTDIPNIDFGNNGPAGLWLSSGDHAQCTDPHDAQGRAWFEPNFDDGSWSAITPPDYGWDCTTCSRSYRYKFYVPHVADLVDATLYFASDDEMKYYVNGHLLDDFGCGTCCINSCGCGGTMPAVPIKSYLHDGLNVVAIQVENAIGGSYFFGTVRLNPGVPMDCSPLAITWGNGNEEWIASAALTANGDIYAVGTTSSGDHDILLLRFGKTGNLLWSKSYDFGVVENAHAITLAPDGNLIISAYIETRYVDALLMKIDPAGNKIWANTWGSGAWDPGGDHVTDAAGNTYQEVSSTGGGAGIDGVLLKYGPGGNPLWSRAWRVPGNINNSGSRIALDPSGNVFVAGFTGAWTDPGGQDLQIQKWDPAGTLLWDRVWVRAGTEHGYGLTIGPDGSAYVGGFTTNFGLGNDDCILMKFLADGTPKWQKAWGGARVDQIYSMSIGPDQLIRAVGTTSSFGGTNDVLLLSYDTGGNLKSQQVWATGGSELAYTIQGSAGGCYVIGGSGFNCSGAWSDVVGTEGVPSGTILYNQGTVVAPVGTVMPVTPTITDYTGTPCTGGGGQDALLLRFSGPGKPTTTAESATIQAKTPTTGVPSVSSIVNYPNPFNAGTSIQFDLPDRDRVVLDIINVLGQKVTTLVDGDLQAGPHTLTWDGRDGRGNSVSSGLYFYRLTTSKQSITKKMLLLK